MTRVRVLGVCAIWLLLVGCANGGSNSNADVAPPGAPGGEGRTTYPLTIENCGSTETFTKPPETVLTEGAPAMTALLISLGLKDKIVKTTIFSTRTDIPGMTAQLESLNRVQVASLGLSREDAIALHPDLIVAGLDLYFQPKKGFTTRAQLHTAGIQAYAPSYFCADNVENPSPEAVAARKAATIEAHLSTITEIGRIFDVPDRAAKLVAEIRQAIDDTRAKVANLPPKKVTITDPSIADTAKSGGKFYVYGGKVLDELMAAAGGTNLWADVPGFQAVSKEDATVRLANVVVYGLYDGAPSPDAVMSYIQITFPSWPAAQNRSVVQLDDVVNLQITHPILVTSLGKALHPEVFK